MAAHQALLRKSKDSKSKNRSQVTPADSPSSSCMGRPPSLASLASLTP